MDYSSASDGHPIVIEAGEEIYADNISCIKSEAASSAFKMIQLALLTLST